MWLTSGGKYRVYAVYATSAVNENYARNVLIKGADKIIKLLYPWKQANQFLFFSVADISKPKSKNGYILDETNILKAPITVCCIRSCLSFISFLRSPIRTLPLLACPSPSTSSLPIVRMQIFLDILQTLCNFNNISQSDAVSPVISAQLASGKVDSSVATVSPSC